MQQKRTEDTWWLTICSSRSDLIWTQEFSVSFPCLHGHPQCLFVTQCVHVCVMHPRLIVWRQCVSNEGSWTIARASGRQQIQRSLTRCLHQSKVMARGTVIYAPDKFISAPKKLKYLLDDADKVVGVCAVVNEQCCSINRLTGSLNVSL